MHGACSRFREHSKKQHPKARRHRCVARGSRHLARGSPRVQCGRVERRRPSRRRSGMKLIACGAALVVVAAACSSSPDSSTGRPFVGTPRQTSSGSRKPHTQRDPTVPRAALTRAVLISSRSFRQRVLILSRKGPHPAAGSATSRPWCSTLALRSDMDRAYDRRPSTDCDAR